MSERSLPVLVAGLLAHARHAVDCLALQPEQDLAALVAMNDLLRRAEFLIAETLTAEEYRAHVQRTAVLRDALMVQTNGPHGRAAGSA